MFLKPAATMALAALGLCAGLVIVKPTPASAQTATRTVGCGPESHWTGQVCIGPLGKAYCPQGMSMEGQTCVATTQHLSGAIVPAAATSQDESDHELIIKMLTNLTAQVSAQQTQIAQMQDALKALQVTSTLAMNNADKARVASVNAEAAVTNIQTSVTSANALALGIQTKVLLLQGMMSQTQDKVNAVQAKLLDTSRRLYAMCFNQSIDENGGKGSNRAQCTSAPYATVTPPLNFDTPF